MKKGGVSMNEKLEIPRTKYHRAVNLACIIMLAGTFIWLIINWQQLPDQLPAHYNGVGEIDRWGSKYEILFCPIVAVLMYLGIGLLERHPQVWNTGVEVTRKNQLRIYTIVKNMIVTMKLVMVFVFTFITVNTTTARPLPAWFLPGTLILTFGPMIYFLIQLYKKR